MHIKRTATIAARERDVGETLKIYTEKLSKTSPEDLVAQRDELLTWNGPRIDLFTFASVLDHFDDILSELVTKYSLETAFALINPHDAKIILVVLDVSRLYIERGSNRGIYSSIPSVSALLQCANSDIIISALNLISKLLALRYGEVKPHSRPAPLRNLPAEILQVFVQQQPAKIDYMIGNQLHQFSVNKALTLEEQMLAIPQGIDQTVYMVSMLRAAYHGDEFEVSQFYAASVATLINDPNLYINSHIIDQILPASTASPEFKRIAYDCLRDMCASQSQLVDRRRQLAVPFSSMHLVSQLSQILRDMENDTLEIDTTIAFFRLISQGHMGISIPSQPLVNFIQNGSSKKYLNVQTAAMMALYTLLMEKQSNLDEFITSRGIDKIIDALSLEISQNLEEVYTHSLIDVDYQLSYDRVQWFKSLFVILSNVLKRKSSRSIVARLLNTPILDVLVMVISKAHTFGWLIVSMCIQVLSILLKEEESIITLFMETYDGQKLVLSLLGWTDNPYYFSPMFHFSAALLSSEKGKELIMSNQILEKLFDALAVSNLASYGSLNAVGHGIEEINSECPELQEHVTKLVIKFIESVDLGKVAAPLWVGTDGVDGGPLECEPPKASAILLNVMFLLDSIFSNHHIMILFLKLRGLDPLLDLICHPAIPFDLVLSKEMYKPDHAFCHTMELLFSLEADTEYIMTTLINRLDKVALKIKSMDCKIYDESPESYESLSEFSALNMLIHTFNVMIFSGTSYHITLAIKGLVSETHKNFVENIVNAYKIAVSEHATLVSYMPEDDLVASWPISACFNIKHSPKDLEIINKSKPLVSEKFLYFNYARCTLSLCYYRISGVVTALVGDLNKESILHRCEKEAYKLSQKISDGAIACLHMPDKCEMPLLYYRDVGEMVAIEMTGRQRFNSNVFVFFKQAKGIQRLIEVHELILNSPEPKRPIRLYLNPRVTPKHFTVYAQTPYFALYRFILYESEVLSRSHIASDLMSGFNLQQLYVEARILVLAGLARLSEQLPLIRPRSLISFCDAIKLAIKPVRGTLPTLDRETLPQRFDWRVLRGYDEKFLALLDLGVSQEDAKGQLESCQNNLDEAVYRLQKSKYPEIAKPPKLSYGVGNEMPLHNGKPVVTLEDLNGFSEHVLEEVIVPALVKISRKSEFGSYFIASAIAQIPGITDILGKDLNSHIELIAIMMRDIDFFTKVYPLVREADFRPLVMSLNPYALTIIEQLLAKAGGTSEQKKYNGSLDGVDFKFYRDEFNPPVWNQSDSEEFLKVLIGYDNMSPAQFATSSRFLLLLCSKSPLFSQQIVESGYFWKMIDLLTSPAMATNKAYMNRASVYVYMLVPILIESEYSLRNYIIRYLTLTALDSNFYDIVDHIHTWNGYLFRCPLIFLNVLKGLAISPGEGSRVLITDTAIKKFAKQLLEALESDELRAKYNLSFGDPPEVQDSFISDGQKLLVEGILDKFIACSEEYAKSVASIGESGNLSKEEQNDLHSQFQTVTYQVSLYLGILRIAVGFSSDVVSLIMSYPEVNNVHERKPVVLNAMVRNLLAISGPYKSISKTQEQLSASTGHIISLLASIPADTGYTVETVAACTERVRVIVECFCKILVHEFLAVKQFKFRERLQWRYSLLQQILNIFTREIAQAKDPRLQKVNHIPIVETAVVEKKLVQVVGLCLAKVDIGQSEGADSVRTAINHFFKWVNDFESRDYSTDMFGMMEDDPNSREHGSDGANSEQEGEIIIEMGSDADLDSDSEVDLEIQYGDFPSSHRGPHNLFRNSTLGMYEQNSDEYHSDDPQEYDHISDDEVLSDMDEDEDDDEEREQELFDEEFDGYEEDFVEDIDAELDLSDNAHDSENDSFSENSATAHDYLDDHFGGITDASDSDGDIIITHDGYDSDSNAPVMEVNRIIPSTSLRRFSEGTNQRPVVLTNSETHWLQSPIWLTPQQIMVENSTYNSEGRLESFDSDGIYIPGVDLPDISARSIGSPLNILPKLSSPSAMFTQLNHMFAAPQYYNTENTMDAIVQILSANKQSQVEQLKSLQAYNDHHGARASGNSIYESGSDSDDHSVLSFNMEIQPRSGDVSTIEQEDDTVASIEDDVAGENPTPYHITIDDREIDVASLGIDPLFLEALPDEIRQEFLRSYISDHVPYSDESSEHGDDPMVIDHLSGQLMPTRAFTPHNQRFHGGGHHNSPHYSPNLLDSVSESVQRPYYSFWVPMTKPETGVFEWSSTIDNRILTAIIRQFYIAQDPEQINSATTLFIRLCPNKLLRDQILDGMLKVLENICTGKVSEGLLELNRVISEGTAGYKFRQVQYVQPPYENLCDLVGQVGDVLIQVFTNLLESDYDHDVDVLALLHQLMKLFGSRIVYTSPRILDWVSELSAQLSSAYTRMIEVDNMDSQAESDWEDTSATEGEDEAASSPVNLGTPGSTGDAAPKASNTPPASVPSGLSEHIGRLVSVLSSDVCSSSAFRDTLQVLSDVHSLPGIYAEIKTKVLKDGRKFRQRVTADLKDLHSGDDDQLDLEILGKFSSGSAAQTKLLRITTFVDYLLDTRKVEDRDKRRHVYSELIAVFKGINLYPAWNELGKCLKLIEKANFRFSTVLLPLIECITVISKRVLNAEKENSYSGWLRNKFVEFSLEHRTILNHLVRMNPKLLSGSFAVLSKDSRVLDFDNKLRYFNRRAIEEKEKLGIHLTRLTVSRTQVFLDTYRALFFKKPEEVKAADIQVTFQDEDGVDAGGVTREWYETLSKQIFNPDYALFLPTSTGSNVFRPNPASYINPEHLSFFKFIGKIIGKAVYDGRVMSCYFCRPLYKCLLQRPVVLSDMEAVDEDYYKSLLWMLENDITDVLNETFSVEEERFGEVKVIDLMENGSEIPVTEENKHSYVDLLVRYTLVDSVAPQIKAIVEGFNEMIPEKIRPVFFELFDEREIELLICGLPDIDIEDWQDNTSYQSYSAQSTQIKWFWTAVASFDNEQRAKLLQYATGTSKVPVGGFAKLETSNNAPKFSIVRDFGDSSRLPSAHTCTNQIDLPLYDSYQQLRTALLKAIIEGSSGFGLA